jgi:glucose/mannose transport system permease protein
MTIGAQPVGTLQVGPVPMPVPRSGWRSRQSVWADRWLPILVLSPSLFLSFVFVFVFMAMTGYLSFTNSTLMPRYVFVGLARYRDLFSNDIWWSSVANLAWFTVPFIGLSLAIGLGLALLLDQRIRFEGGLRALFLYPLALSQIVAGTAWQWLLNPNLGVEQAMHQLGWTSFHFRWLSDPDRAIFCVALAAVWQCSGFVTALFLAGLRGVDDEVLKAAQVDGASLPRIYYRVVLPMMRPVFFSVLLILTHLAIKTFDLVVAMTAGGPGVSTGLPSIFMFTYSFERGRMGVGAASAMMIVVLIIAILVPLMYAESRSSRDAR